MKLNAAELQVPGGKLYQDGDTCEGQARHSLRQAVRLRRRHHRQLFNGRTVSCPSSTLATSPRDQALLTHRLRAGIKTTQHPAARRPT